MIRGTVTASREPVVRLRIRGPGGSVADVELVVDTGFTGAAVLAMSVGPQALLGMRLLDGHRLAVEGSPGGVVEIVPWP